MFPSYAPQISLDDPRLCIIADKMRNTILRPKIGVKPTALEFEVKLGQIEMNHQFHQRI